MSDDELGPPRWLWRWLAAVSTVAVAAVVATIVVVGISALERQRDIAETQRIALAIDARTDCSRAIGSRFAEIREVRDDLRAEAQRQINAALLTEVLTGGTPSAEVIDEFVRTNELLVAATEDARALPRLSVAVEDGYPPLDIKPCPTV
jgi:hypothetical protein